jgi:hypothetical protein
MDGKNSREASNSTYDGKAGKTAGARMPATTGTPVIVGTTATARRHAANEKTTVATAMTTEKHAYTSCAEN